MIALSFFAWLPADASAPFTDSIAAAWYEVAAEREAELADDGELLSLLDSEAEMDDSDDADDAGYDDGDGEEEDGDAGTESWCDAAAGGLPWDTEMVTGEHGTDGIEDATLLHVADLAWASRAAMV